MPRQILRVVTEFRYAPAVVTLPRILKPTSLPRPVVPVPQPDAVGVRADADVVWDTYVLEPIWSVMFGIDEAMLDVPWLT